MMPNRSNPQVPFYMQAYMQPVVLLKRLQDQPAKVDPVKSNDNESADLYGECADFQQPTDCIQPPDESAAAHRNVSQSPMPGPSGMQRMQSPCESSSSRRNGRLSQYKRKANAPDDETDSSIFSEKPLKYFASCAGEGINGAPSITPTQDQVIVIQDSPIPSPTPSSSVLGPLVYSPGDSISDSKPAEAGGPESSQTETGEDATIEYRNMRVERWLSESQNSEAVKFKVPKTINQKPNELFSTPCSPDDVPQSTIRRSMRLRSAYNIQVDTNLEHSLPSDSRTCSQDSPIFMEMLNRKLQAFEVITPPASQPKPPASQPTPPASQPTQSASQPTPPASQPTPPASQPTPPASQPTPPARQPTPLASQPTPPASQPAPPASQPTPPARQPTPHARDPSPPAPPTPLAREPTPVAREPSLPARDPTPPVRDPMRPAQDITASRDLLSYDNSSPGESSTLSVGFNSPAHETAENNDLQYLCLVKQGSKIIQIKPFKLPEHRRNIMSDKSVLSPEMDSNALEHDRTLLGQLVEAFQQTTSAQAELGEQQRVNTGPDPAGLNQSKSQPLLPPGFSTSLRNNKRANMLTPPVFSPTEAEFQDPIAYFEKIMPEAAKYGVVKVVAPQTFRPKCHLSDDIRFNVCNQYLGRMYCRWTPAARELCAIKAYLALQDVHFTRPPLMKGLEVNLPKLYHLVQRHGGLKKVIQKKRWALVAEELRFTQGPNPEKQLDKIYVKYLLPYDTLSHNERQEILSKVENAWFRKHRRMIDRALNPLHRQRRLLGESESSDDEAEEEKHLTEALFEAEDCVVSGRGMNVATFKRVATAAMDSHFPDCSDLTSTTLENEYWRAVLLGADHICVYTASIDTGEEGYGFTKDPNDSYAQHPWNLKMVSQNSGNVLRSLGSNVGVTLPTLHLGMVFSTSCWHRDPHGLPWIEYMHTGPGKIWYGIPDEESDKFCRAVENLCPTSRQNKTIWLPSDITMIPPALLLEHNVSISSVEQQPGEFIIVFPKAYSSSISKGYTISESVYFATHTWLSSVQQIFTETRESCEPTMFALEELLVAIARDNRTPLSVLTQVHNILSPIVLDELEHRQRLLSLGVAEFIVNNRARSKNTGRPAGAWNVREQDECDICRSTLYLSKVVGLTGNKSSVCLQHALRLLESEKKKVYGRGSELVPFFTNHDLNNLMDDLKKKIVP